MIDSSSRIEASESQKEPTVQCDVVGDMHDKLGEGLRQLKAGRRMIEIQVRRGGLAPMLVQGMWNGRAIEAARAFDVSDTEPFPCWWTLSAATQEILVGELAQAAQDA